MVNFLSSLAVMALAAPSWAALTYKGADWSSGPVEEAAGIKWYPVNQANTAQPLETILANSGVNTVRQRLWVNPTANNGAYNLKYNLDLARRARAAGMKVYLDLHYSDTWADPAHQTIPAGWPTDLAGLNTKIFEYTRDVCNSFYDDQQASGNTRVDALSIISIGNEITAGLLWPVGTTSSYDAISELLHSASAGVKASRISPKPKIMIHLDNGWSWSTQQNFYSKTIQPGKLQLADFDMMGVSYYPFYNSAATLASLKTSLTNMASTYGKQLVVAETNWPTSCPSPAFAFPSDTRNIPFSPAGQTTWMKDVAAIVEGVSGGVGLFYWEPMWINNAGLGSSCNYNLMVATTGQALTSLSVFSQI